MNPEICQLAENATAGWTALSAVWATALWLGY